MSRRAQRWTVCWTCEEDIMSERECNYVKTRDIDIKICPKCYEDFKKAAKDFLRLEKKAVNSVAALLSSSLYSYHQQEHGTEDFDNCIECNKACNWINDSKDEFLKQVKKELNGE